MGKELEMNMIFRINDGSIVDVAQIAFIDRVGGNGSIHQYNIVLKCGHKIEVYEPVEHNLSMRKDLIELWKTFLDQEHNEPTNT
jgi:hypothetical protein